MYSEIMTQEMYDAAMKQLRDFKMKDDVTIKLKLRAPEAQALALLCKNFTVAMADECSENREQAQKMLAALFVLSIELARCGNKTRVGE